MARWVHGLTFTYTMRIARKAPFSQCFVSLAATISLTFSPLAQRDDVVVRCADAARRVVDGGCRPRRVGAAGCAGSPRRPVVPRCTTARSTTQVMEAFHGGSSPSSQCGFTAVGGDGDARGCAARFPALRTPARPSLVSTNVPVPILSLQCGVCGGSSPSSLCLCGSTAWAGTATRVDARHASPPFARLPDQAL